jgi:hypothetical protein
MASALIAAGVPLSGSGAHGVKPGVPAEIPGE